MWQKERDRELTRRSRCDDEGSTGRSEADNSQKKDLEIQDSSF